MCDDTTNYGIGSSFAYDDFDSHTDLSITWHSCSGAEIQHIEDNYVATWQGFAYT